jgi:hypothetical protein
MDLSIEAKEALQVAHGIWPGNEIIAKLDSIGSGSAIIAAANTILAGPTSGTTGAPAYRNLVAADIPPLSASKITTGQIAVAQGGTGLAALGIASQVLCVNTAATALEYRTLVAGANITITPSTGQVVIAATGLGAVGTAGQIQISTGTGGFAALTNFAPVALMGNPTGIAAAPSPITLGANLSFSGTTLVAAGASAPAGTAGQIQVNSGVGTLGALNNFQAVSLMGNPTASPAAPAPITLGSNLSLAGAVLNAAGGGTVTSVDLAVPNIMTVAGSPVTTAGTITLSLATQFATTVWAGPVTGSPASPAFRTLQSTDIPNLSATQITSGQLSVFQGGTGLSSLTANAVMLGEGSALPGFATVGLAGRALLDQGSGVDPIFRAISGDGTLSMAGALSVTKTGGVAFAPSATTDTTNATNITSGILAVPRGGTGLGTLTAHAVVLGEGIAVPGFATIGTAGRVLLDLGAAADPAFTALSGDLTIAGAGVATLSPGVVTLAKQAPFAASSLMGNSTVSAATPAAIPLGSGLSFVGGALTSTATGTGTVTSVSWTGDGTIFSAVASAAVTTSGTLTPAGLVAQAQKTVLAGPVSGVNATPTFRALQSSDIPNLSASQITSGVLPVPQGGTGLGTLTAHAVIVGEGTAIPGFVTPGVAGRCLLDQGATADPSFQAVSGDGTLSAAGALAVTKTGGVAFAPSATIDTTNATNITSGLLAVARGGTGLGTLTANAVLLGEGTATLGFAAVALAGRVLIDQGAGVDPGFHVISGDGTLSAAGALLVTKTGGTAFAASATTDTTNATNITSGLLAVARGGTGLGTLTAHAVVLGEGTAVPGFATIGTAGRVLLDQGAAADPAFTAVSGDLTLSPAGAATIQPLAITTGKIAANAVTYGKMQTETASTLLGNPTGTVAAPVEIPLGSGMSFVGGALTATAAGTGTVTSVSWTGDGTIFSAVASAAVTTSGTLTPAGLVTQVQKTVLAGPATGANAAPTFRALQSTDIPNLSAAQITSGILPVPQGGTGLATLTAHGVVLGEGTAVPGFATVGTAGRVLIDQGAAADPVFTAVSGDGTLSAAGALAVTKTGGTAFAPSATIDTTNAANISSGLLAVARGGTGLGTLTANAVMLGEGTASLGFAIVGLAGRVLIDQGSGVDPNFHAISGDGTLSAAGALLVTKTNSVAFAASATTDTTNATNISSGLLAVARGGTGLGTLTAHAVVLGEGTAVPGFATIGTAGRVLLDQGTALDPAFTAMSGDVVITSAGVVTIQPGAVTLAKQANLAASSLQGNPTGLAATPSAITLGAGLSFSGTTLVAAAGAVSSVFTRTGAIVAATGDYTVSQVTGAAPLASPTFTGTVTLPAGTVTLAQQANLTASTLMGNPTGSAAAPSAVPLGSGLSFVGGALTATVTGGGTVTSVSWTGDGTIFSAVASAAVTTSGTLVPAGLVAQAQNTVLAGSATVSSAVPTFRTLQAADIPNISAAKITSGILTVPQGGTGLATLTAHGVMLGEGTAVPGFATAALAGRVLVDQGSTSDPAFQSISGDATLSSGGALLVTKTNSVAFAPSATTDTTNASNITSGLITVARGGTGLGTLAAHAVLLGEGTLTPGFAMIGTAGRVLLDQGAGTDPGFTSLFGDVNVGSGGVTTIQPGVVTFAKQATLVANSLVGNPTGTAATPSTVGLGSNLSFSGSNLALTGVALLGSTNTFTANHTTQATTICEQTGSSDVIQVENSSAAIQGGINSSINPYGIMAPDVISGRLSLAINPRIDGGTGTTLYYVPYGGRGCITLYNTTNSYYENWLLGTSGISLSLAGLAANTVYDVFIYNNAGTLTLTTVAWSNSGMGTSARASGLSSAGDYIYLSGFQNRRYLGTFYTSATGTTIDSPAARLVFNTHNQIVKSINVVYTPSPNPWVLSNGSTLNSLVVNSIGGSSNLQFQCVNGLTLLVQINLMTTQTTGGPGINCYSSIGVNSASAFGAISGISQATPLTAVSCLTATLSALGFNAFIAIAGIFASSASQTVSFYNPAVLVGSVFC